MPIFDFKCVRCKEVFESIEKASIKVTKCKECDGVAYRLNDIEGKTLIKFKEPGGVYNSGFAERKYQ